MNAADLFRCPVCVEADPTGGHLRSTSEAFLCPACAARYPIVNGVPRFLAGKESREVQSTFSEQWSLRDTGQFEKKDRVFWISNRQAVDSLTQLLKLPEPLSGFFLDAGCGSGEKSIELARKFPDCQIVAMDFSTSVFSVKERAKDLTNFTVICGDVAHPPFAPQTFDHIVSIGVLHHTENTAQAFRALAKLVKPAGSLTTWIYPAWSESPLFQKTYYFIRDILFFGRGHLLTANLRLLLLRLLCAPLMLLMPFFLLSRFVERGIYRDLSARDLYNGLVFMLYDDLAPRFQWRHTQAEIRSWYAESGYADFRTPSFGLQVATKS